MEGAEGRKSLLQEVAHFCHALWTLLRECGLLTFLLCAHSSEQVHSLWEDWPVPWEVGLSSGLGTRQLHLWGCVWVRGSVGGGGVSRFDFGSHSMRQLSYGWEMPPLWAFVFYKMRTALPTSWGVLLCGLNEVQPLPDIAEGQYKIILLGQKHLAQPLQIV